MFRILDRYIFRELLGPFVIGLVLFTFVLIMNVLLDLARYTIRGDVSMAQVLTILVWSLPHILALAIPMSVLLAANLGLGRMAADNEITVMHASGVSLLSLGRALFVFALLATLVTGHLTMRLVPQANQKAREQLWDMAKRQLHQGIKAGEFFERYAGYVIYTENIDEDTNVWSNVLVADSNRPQEPILTLANQGRMHYNEADKFVVLELTDGQIVQLDLEAPDRSTVSGFTSHKLVFNLENFIPQSSLTPTDREMSLGRLSAEIRKRQQAGIRWRPLAVELHKKFAIPTACLVFAIVGLAVGARNKTRGRSAGFVVSLGIILVYYLFLTTGERMGDQGDLSPWLAMWAPNIVVGGLGLVLLVLQVREVELGIWDRIATWMVHTIAVTSRALDRGKHRIVVDTPHQHEESPLTPAAAFPADDSQRRRTIVIRIPKVNLDLARILDRYLLKEWTQTFVMVLLAITSLYLIVDLSRLLDDITENDVPAATVVEYYQYALPNIVYLVQGPTALVATLIIIGILSRNNEIIAMKTSGISIYRIIMPVVAVVAVLCAITFFVNDRVIPIANRRALSQREDIQRGPKRSHQYLGSRWLWGKESRTLYNYTSYNPSSFVMEGVRVFELERNRFRLRRITVGARANWVERGGWQFEDTWVRRFEESSSPFQRHAKILMPFGEDPDYFVAEKKAADELSYGELTDYIHQLERAGYSVQSLRVRLSQKLALPFVPMIMTLVGIPFALRIGKRGNLFGVGVAVAVVMAFWATIAAFGPLGETGVLPALLAAWAPLLIFGSGGLYLLLTLDT